MKWQVWLLGVFSAVTMTACGEDGPRSCTLIGCIDSLTIEVSDSTSTRISSLSGAVTIDGGTPQEFCCDGALADCQTPSVVNCKIGGFAILTNSSEIAITVTSSAGESFSGTLDPDYTRSQPNGDGCPPICDNAVVAVSVQ